MSEREIVVEIVGDIKSAWDKAQAAKPYAKMVSSAQVIEIFEKELVNLDKKWRKRYDEVVVAETKK